MTDTNDTVILIDTDVVIDGTDNNIVVVDSAHALVRYEAARTALAECHRVDEVKDIRDKAEAMAAYARQAKDTELMQYATEIKVRAERRCGELLTQTEKNQGARGVGPIAVERYDRNAPTLADMGITKDQSSRYQQLAAMPAEHFETAVATAKDTAGQVTTAFMLRTAKAVARRPRAERVAEIRAMVNSGHLPEQIAKALGIGVEQVRQLMHDAGIRIRMQKAGRAIDSNRIVRESVATLSGIAQGLSLVRHLGIDATEAQELRSELVSAMKAVRALDAILKELAAGETTE